MPLPHGNHATHLSVPGRIDEIMPRRIALVSCVKKKASTPKPARDLYTSDWFRKASAYAMRKADQWYILSAKYGLLAPDTVIAPYDETLNTMRAADRRVWAARVVRDLKKVLVPGDHVVMLAGQRYRADLMDPIQQIGCTAEVPMQGLGIGKQLGWLKQQLE